MSFYATTEHKGKTWYCHGISPIDFNWHMLKTPEEVFSSLKSQAIQDIARATLAWCLEDSSPLVVFAAEYEMALELAKKAGMDSRITAEAVFTLPGDTYFDYGFVFKEEDNGTTYVVAPMLLPPVQDLAL